jgi:tRNA threonylcarbamoyladenosine biosynthesis protein TsaE
VVHLIELLSRCPEQTRSIGRLISPGLGPGDVVALTGTLGSGKSVLARGIIGGLGVEGPVSSPSFVIVSTYRGRLDVNHIDLYRLGGVDDALDVGIEELLYGDSVSIIEWAERLGPLLPPSRLDIRLAQGRGRDERLLAIRPVSAGLRRSLTPWCMDLIAGGRNGRAGD